MHGFTNGFTTLIGKVTLSRSWRQQNGNISTSGQKSDVTIISSVWTVKIFEMHHRAKFRQNRSKRFRVMAILNFSRWRPPPSWILNFKFLTVMTLNRVELHHHAKFASKLLKPRLRYDYFSIFKMRPPPLGFVKFLIFNGRGGQQLWNASSCQISSKLVKTRPSYGNFNFFKKVTRLFKPLPRYRNF